MTTPWHMARVASRRQLPKPRKMHDRGVFGMIYGEPVLGQIGHSRHRCRSTSDEGACSGCGYHVCSCKPVERKKYMFPVLTGVEHGQTSVWCQDCNHGGHCTNAIDCPKLVKAQIEHPFFNSRPGSVDAQIYPSFERKACCGALVKDFCGCMPGSVDVAGLEKLRAEWEQRLADAAAQSILEQLRTEREV